MDIHLISNELKLGNDGIWYSIDTQNISYPVDGHNECLLIEEKSFWFKHRNNCILSAIKNYPPKDGGTIFDIGGGNGFVSSMLAASGFDVALVEPGRVGALNARRRGLNTVICSSLNTAQFKSHSLSAIGLFDVIEHIEDDLSFLKSIKELIKKEGRLYITVPAYPLLWSEEDIFAGHFRRYTLKRICEVIKHADFKVEYATYFFRFLPIPIAFLRTIPYRLGLSRAEKKKVEASNHHVIKNKVFTNILSSLFDSEIENLRKNKSMAFGGSCLIVAKVS